LILFKLLIFKFVKKREHGTDTIYLFSV